MKAIDHQQQLNDIVLDERRKIPEDHLENICKIHQGKVTCRYICLSVDGYVCVKNSNIDKVLDKQVEQETMSACGDNCPGIFQE